MCKVKLLSVICAAVILCVSVLPCFAADVKPEIITVKNKTIQGHIVDITPKNVINSRYKMASAALYSKQAATSRDTLNEYEKEIYDYFKNAPFGTMEYEAEFENYYALPYETYFDDLFYEDDSGLSGLHRILYSLLLDCPDLFYIESISAFTTYIDTNKNGDPDVKDRWFLEIELLSYDSIGDIYELKTQIDEKIATMDVSKCHNRYDLIKTFHQFLCEAADYDFDYLDRFDPEHPEYVKHNIIGTLLDGSCVCQGYAESFKMLCDLYKIPCICVEGEANGGGHEWNAVLMDDGRWYLIDVTWDDDIGTSNYFLKSGAYFAANDHTEYIYPYSPRISYSSTNFSAATVLTEFNATYNCRASKTRSGNFLYRSVFDVNEPIYYNGLWLKDCTAAANGAKFTAPSGSSYANENWQLILIGDVTGDGECTAEDYSAAVTKALGSESAHISAANMAADADFDGYLDVLDVSIIERMTTGANTQIEIG